MTSNSDLCMRAIPSNLFQIVSVLVHLKGGQTSEGRTTIAELCHYLDRGMDAVRGMIRELVKAGWLVIRQTASRSRPLVFLLNLNSIPLRDAFRKAVAAQKSEPRAKTRKREVIEAPPPESISTLTTTKNLVQPEVAIVVPSEVHAPVQEIQIPTAPTCQPEVISERPAFDDQYSGFESRGCSRFGLFSTLIERDPRNKDLTIPENPDPWNFRPWLYPKAKVTWLAHYGLDDLCLRVEKSRIVWAEGVVNACIEQMTWAKPAATDVVARQHLMNRVGHLRGMSGFDGDKWDRSLEFLRNVLETAQKFAARVQFAESRPWHRHDLEILDDVKDCIANGKPIIPTHMRTYNRAVEEGLIQPVQESVAA